MINLEGLNKRELKTRYRSLEQELENTRARHRTSYVEKQRLIEGLEIMAKLMGVHDNYLLGDGVNYNHYAILDDLEEINKESNRTEARERLMLDPDWVGLG